MRVLSVLLLCLVLLQPVMAVSGSFRGIVVEAPGQSAPEWIFVQGRNRLARKVNVAAAKVTYDEAVPPALRRSDTPAVFSPGTEVRVTAEQDEAGEWRATEVEILQLPDTDQLGKKHVAGTTARP